MKHVTRRQPTPCRSNTYLTINMVESSKSCGDEHLLILWQLARRHVLYDGVVKAGVEAPLLEHADRECRYVDACQNWSTICEINANDRCVKNKKHSNAKAPELHHQDVLRYARFLFLKLRNTMYEKH